MWKRFFTVAAIGALVFNAHAADGFTVNVDYSGWDGNYTGDDNYTPYAGIYLNRLSGPLKLYRSDVANNKVTTSTVICDDPCAYPAISLKGDKIVFYRKSGSNWHISVVNKNGTGLDDLADVSSNSGAVLEWPEGDYVYYAKTLSGEFWKVNVNTKQKERVWQPSETGPDSWRFTMPADGKACAYRGFGENNMAFNCFPPKTSCMPTLSGISAGNLDGPRIQSCNIQVSPSGAYLFTYINNMHKKVDGIHQWNRITNEVSYLKAATPRATLNPDAPGGKSSYIRAASNSDKWFIELHRDAPTAVASNWVDEKAFVIGAGRSNGDFWIQPPSGKVGMIETTSGDWIGTAVSTQNPRMLEHASAKPSHMVSPKLRIRSLHGSMTPEIYLGNQSRRVDIRGRVLPLR